MRNKKRTTRKSVRLTSALGAMVGMLFAGGAVYAQDSADLQAVLKELQAIKAAQAAIQKELGELKALVQTRPAAPAAAARPPVVGRTINIGDGPFKGLADAPLTLVEYSDFQCPFCARHFTQTLPQLMKEYIDTGKVKYVFRHYPLESIHPLAFKASEASECADEQNKFWPMHDRLFENRTQLAPEMLPGHAKALGLNMPAFEQCLASGRHAPNVRKDLTEGQSVGVTGTPAFLLGRTVPGGQIKVEAFLVGARAYVGFKSEIDRLLATP